MPASCSTSSKSVRRAFVRARIAISSSGAPSARISATIAAPSSSGVGERRARPAPARPASVGAQRLLGAAEARDEPVRELEHLRRRAVVLLEPDDERVREAARHAEQVLGAGAGERVDRLVVVADDAEVVAVAEPEVEQRLLQQVDVLVLVDGERAVLRAERRRAPARPPRRAAPRARAGPRSRSAPSACLPPLVLAVDALHQVERDRRLAAVGLAR